MKNFNYYDEHDYDCYDEYENDYYGDNYCDTYIKKEKISKTNKKKIRHDEDLFNPKSGKKKKKDYKKLQKEKEKMKLDAVNNLFLDCEDEE